MISGIAITALALFGEFSPFLATAEYLVAHLPNCRRALIPGAKHRAPEENAPGFVEALTLFLNDVDQDVPAGSAVCDDSSTDHA
jgi:pimeloyl-ACP methyl ester carboxylesterase